MDFNKLAARARITIPSARNMHWAALSKLAKLNPEPSADEGDDAGPLTGVASPSATPSRRGDRPRGRPRKNKGADAATTEPKDGTPKGDDQAQVNESEVEMKDANEETGTTEDEV